MRARLYTGTGDRGETSLADGRRVPKSDPTVEAYGTLDEAMAAVGLARVATTDEALSEMLGYVQHRLYACAALVSGARPDRLRPLSADDVSYAERSIDELSSRTPQLHGFVLAGGSEASARLDLARSVVRRAERRCADLSGVDEHMLTFLNRSSDLLFAASRLERVLSGMPEELWDAYARPPATGRDAD